MRILFLDDNEDRHLSFNRMTRGMDVEHVYTVEQATGAMAKEQFDLACLDHDLGGEAFVDEIEGSGTEVALYIRDELPQDKLPKKIIIHSWNPAGAARMFKIISERMSNVVEIPFKYV